MKKVWRYWDLPVIKGYDCAMSALEMVSLFKNA